MENWERGGCSDRAPWASPPWQALPGAGVDCVRKTQAVCEQKQLSHSGEPCPDGWEQSRVRFGRAVCSGLPPVCDSRQNRWPGFFCVSLFVSPHTSKKHVCVQKAFSGSHFYNEKSSREVQLNKMCVCLWQWPSCPPARARLLTEVSRVCVPATAAKSLDAGSGCSLLEFNPLACSVTYCNDLYSWGTDAVFDNRG